MSSSNSSDSPDPRYNRYVMSLEFNPHDSLVDIVSGDLRDSADVETPVCPWYSVEDPRTFLLLRYGVDVAALKQKAVDTAVDEMLSTLGIRYSVADVDVAIPGGTVPGNEITTDEGVFRHVLSGSSLVFRETL